MVLRPTLAMARDERQLAEEHRQQRRLARAVAALDGEPVARGEVDVDGAEPERPALRDRALQRCEAVAAALAGAQRQPQLPRLERLLDLVDALERALCLPHLRHQRMRAAPVGAARVLAHRVAVRTGLARALLQPAPPRAAAAPARRRSARTAAAARARAALRTRSSRRPTRGRRASTGRPRRSASPSRSRSARSCDTTTRPPRAPQQEALEEVEPVEVEVVRRLVEQQHVEAREEDRSECEPRRLPAGELHRRPARGRRRGRARRRRRGRARRGRRRRAPGTGRARARRLAGGGIRRQRGGEVGERRAPPPRSRCGAQVAADRLVRPYVRLLRQVADRQRRRRARHRPRVGGLEPRCEPEQGRLARRRSGRRGRGAARRRSSA